MEHAGQTLDFCQILLLQQLIVISKKGLCDANQKTSNRQKVGI